MFVMCVSPYRGEYRVLYVTPEFTASASDLLKELHSKVGKCPTVGPHAYSQIAHRKLCARIFNYVIWWVSVMVEGWDFG